MSESKNERRMKAAHLRALRTALGLSVKGLADMLGHPNYSAMSWDTGRYYAPDEVVDDLELLHAHTVRSVEDLAEHFREHGGPMVIPRSPADLPWTVEGVDVPADVTLDWWKLVAVRVCEMVPGLRIEWPQ